MALNVANWTDKQLDELADLLRSADYSAVASFIAESFLCTQPRIMDDPPQTPLRATVGGDPKTIVLSAGVFLLDNLVSDIETDQVVNILDTGTGAWGPGLAADPVNPRWDIVQVKNNQQLNTPDLRWFVNDTVIPNTYYQQTVNTQINKAYYDIVVKHGTPGPVPVVPDADVGYWPIVEIYVPASAGALAPLDVHDTVYSGGSAHIPPFWTSSSRLLRLEYFGNFLPGTRLVFSQPTAPAGWIQDITLNDKALRVVSGAGGGLGGSRPLSATTTGVTQLSNLQIPPHSHDYLDGQNTGTHSWSDGDDHTVWGYLYRSDVSRVTSPAGGSGGSAQGHSHDLSFAYVDVIICIKS